MAIPKAPGRRPGSRRWGCRSRRLAADDSGVASVELALGLVVLMPLLIGIIEMGLLMFMNVGLESGIREAARFGLTGRNQAQREAQIRQIVKGLTFGLIKDADIAVTTMTYLSFGDIGLPEPFTDGSNGKPLNGKYDSGETYTDSNGNGNWDADRGTPGPGSRNAIVVYRVKATWTLMTPVLSGLLGLSGRWPIEASVAVQNEPY